MISEVLPYIEKKYRGVGRPYRYVTGVSSGGWGSLWLQVEYPTEFDGVWSIAPDPIDFRAFISNTNIYEPDANLYFDDEGERKPMGWKGDEVYVWTDGVAQRELFFGNAGQIQSFEAVFSPKADNGRPVPLFDIKAGDIDPDVAEAWKEYDIRLKLEREWTEISPALRNKLHIWVGEEDNFELHKAVIQLRRALAARLESVNADIRVIPDMIHHPPPGMFEEVAADALARFKRAKYWCPERGLDTFDPDHPGCIE